MLHIPQYRLSAFYFARIGSDLPMDFLLPSVSACRLPSKQIGGWIVEQDGGRVTGCLVRQCKLGHGKHMHAC